MAVFKPNAYDTPQGCVGLLPDGRRMRFPCYDEYVDYVGISSYIANYRFTENERKAGYDVLGTGSRLQRWSRQIEAVRDANIFNLGHCGERAADYIIQRMTERSSRAGKSA